MKRLEVSGAVRPIYGSLDVRRLTFPVTTTRYIPWVEFVFPSGNWPVKIIFAKMQNFVITLPVLATVREGFRPSKSFFPNTDFH